VIDARFSKASFGRRKLRRFGLIDGLRVLEFAGGFLAGGYRRGLDWRIN
jgi:hypothetical protein